MNMKRKQKAPKCSVKDCPSVELKKDDITFFSLPTDKIRCRQWLLSAHLSQNLMRKSAKIRQSYHLCSRHFENDQFSNEEKTILKEYAIPTIFDTLTSPKVIITLTGQSHLMEEAHNSGDEEDGYEKDNETDGIEPSVGIEIDHNSLPIGQALPTGQASQRSSIYGPGNTHCQWCSAINCSNNRIKRPDLAYFRFPPEPDRCKKWIINSQRFDLQSKPIKTLHSGNYTLCSEHFEKDCIRLSPNSPRLLLHKWAVPTLFDFSVSSRRTRKPAPTFPADGENAMELRREARIKGNDEDYVPKKYNSRKKKSLKRTHKSAKFVSKECKPKRRLPSLKELKEENMSLTGQLHQLTGSRLKMVKRLAILESKVDVLKAHARIDVGLLTRALDTSRHVKGWEEYDKLKSVIHLLTDKEENGNGSGEEGTISCDSSE